MMNLNTNRNKNESSRLLRENLSKLLNSFQMTEYDLAKSLNIPYNTINRIITGATTDPRISTLEQIADFFGVKIDFFLDENYSSIKKPDHNIPILPWELLSNPDFLKIDRENWEKWIPAAQLIEDMTAIETFFALESTKSMQPRFPFGTTFIIKTIESPIDGDLVLVRFKADNSISLRELIIDSPNWQLNPIISGSKSLLFNHLDHSIIGVVLLTLIQPRST